MRLLRVLARALLILVLAFGVLEASFRLAAALMPHERGLEGIGTDHLVVLCVGDSHTWGAGKGYPARLAERLAERSPRYRVVNYGVPGTNTAQLRNRFAGYLDRFHPRVVIIWSGVNNRHNRAESEVWNEVGIEEASWARRLLDDSRVLRALRMWRQDRELDRLLATTGSYIAPTAEKKDGDRVWGDHRRSLFGDEALFHNVQGDHLTPADQARVTELDMRWMMEQARRRGIPLVVITYPFPAPLFTAANEGIQKAGADYGVPLVDAREAEAALRAQRAAKGEPPPELYDHTLHPTQAFYDAIGDRVLKELDEKGYL